MKEHLLKNFLKNNFPKKQAFYALVIIILLRASWKFRKYRQAQAMLKKASTKRKSRDGILKLPLPVPDLTIEKMEEIRNASILKLSDMLNNDEVTSREILLVFCHRIQSLGPELELIADVNFYEALKMADACDEKRKNTPMEERKTLGPLFGVPISVKDNIKLKGLDATFGLANLCFKSHHENATVVEMLMLKGAIPFVKSNGPQMMMSIETYNNIWGRAKNPWNVSRTTGGSSGGEAGLIASRCSPGGIGSDIAGSVRIPALFCGIYGIKPTVERVSTVGLVYPNEEGKNGNNIIKTVIGPLGKCVDDIREVFKAMVSEEQGCLDPTVSRQRWNDKWEKEALKPLRVGFIDNDDFLETCNSNKRAVKEACEALKKRGHTIVPLAGFMPPLSESQGIYTGVFSSEGKLRSFIHALKGEPMIEAYKGWARVAGLSKSVRKVLAFILWLIGEKRASHLMIHSGEKSANELFQYVKEIHVMKDRLLKLWKTYELDAIITPGLALPALKHDEGVSLYVNGCYANFWNIVNFPTGAMPITKVRKDETEYKEPLRKHQGDYFDKLARRSLIDAEGLPVGIQISTLPFEEEKCLAIMKEIEDVVGFHELPR